MKTTSVIQFFDNIGKAVSSISRVIAGFCVFAMTALITIDVLARYLFGHSTGVSDEISGYLLVAVSFIGLSYAQRVGGHVQVTTISGRFSQQAQKQLKIAVLVVGTIFIGWLAWTTFGPVLMYYSINRISITLLRTPLWIPWTLVPIGLALLCIELITELVRAIFSVDLKKTMSKLQLREYE